MATLTSVNVVSMAVSNVRPKTATSARVTTATRAPIPAALRREAEGRLLIDPPIIDPAENAARNVEISHAQTTMDEPKWGLSNREANSWKPMLRMPRTTTTA